MVSKLLQTEQGLMVLLPAETLELLNLTPDAQVSVTIEPQQNRIIISPAILSLSGVDETFAQQVSDFIEQYRPALTALAK